jgi:hypothetical protein
MRVLFERIENELKKHGQHKRLIEDLHLDARIRGWVVVGLRAECQPRR